MQFAKKLRDLRTDHEPPINQTTLGKALGISQLKVSRLEIGFIEPNLQDLRNICTYYNISADYFLDLIDEPKKLYHNINH